MKKVYVLLGVLLILPIIAMSSDQRINWENLNAELMRKQAVQTNEIFKSAEEYRIQHVQATIGKYSEEYKTLLIAYEDQKNVLSKDKKLWFQESFKVVLKFLKDERARLNQFERDYHCRYSVLRQKDHKI